MRTLRSVLILPASLAMLTGGCAWLTPPPAPVAPPTVDAPEWALEPCQLPTIPVDEPSVGSLARGYIDRGEALIRCEQARRLNAEAHLQERQAVAEWIEE
jgi:hypothetical protein